MPKAPKRWLFHGILSDAPSLPEEEYLTTTELQAAFKAGFLYPGVKVTSLRLTALPERQKKTSKNTALAVEKASENPPKGL